MSYDVDLETRCAHCNHVETYFSRNHTSNTSPMWRAAGVDLHDYDGKPAADLAEPLAGAITYIDSHREEMRQHEPGNGWGTTESTLKFLVAIREACREYPTATVRVSS